MENEIMVNEEVTEAVNVVPWKSGSKLKAATGLAAIVVGGIVVWHYIAKPVLANIKAKKQKPETITADVDNEAHDSEEIEEEKQ